MVPQPLVRQVEVEFLKRVALLISRGKIDMPTAQEWGKELLATLPFSSREDLQHKIEQLALSHPLLENLPLLVQHYLDNEKAHKKAQQVETLIKAQKTEEALDLIK